MKRAAILPAALALALTSPAAVADAAGPSPQGGKWEADGSGPTYREGMPMTRPTGHAIGQYQRLLGVRITYHYDAQTTAAVLRFQQARPELRDTGQIDYPTNFALLEPIIVREARRAGIRPRLLCGHLWVESRMDPGAVGPGSIDYGIGQIVPRYKPGTQPWSVVSSIRRMARDDAQALRTYGFYAGPIAWWKPAEARAAAAGRPSEFARFYRSTIHNAPCGDL